jgi:hypothetical protein
VSRDRQVPTWLSSVGYSGRTSAGVLHAQLAAPPGGATASHGQSLAGITLAYLATLTAIRGQIAALAKQISEALDAHPDSATFTSLPTPADSLYADTPGAQRSSQGSALRMAWWSSWSSGDGSRPSSLARADCVDRYARSASA